MDLVRFNCYEEGWRRQKKCFCCKYFESLLKRFFKFKKGKFIDFWFNQQNFLGCLPGRENFTFEGGFGSCSVNSNTNLQCSFSCEDGYIMVGEPQISCEQETPVFATWSRPPPICIRTLSKIFLVNFFVCFCAWAFALTNFLFTLSFSFLWKSIIYCFACSFDLSLGLGHWPQV